jgi:hypothetical protein
MAGASGFCACCRLSDAFVDTVDTGVGIAGIAGVVVCKASKETVATDG